jgi:hypothetical protein
MPSMYSYPSIVVISLFLYCISISLGAVSYMLNDDINLREKTAIIHICEEISHYLAFQLYLSENLYKKQGALKPVDKCFNIVFSKKEGFSPFNCGLL